MQDDQRTRVLEAMAQAMAELRIGPCGVSAADVQARSGAPDALVEQLLADREAALADAFELGLQRVAPLARGAFVAESRWLDGVKAALAALLGFLEDESALGRLLVLHASSGGERVLRRRLEIIDGLAAVIDRGRMEVLAGRQAPEPLVAEGVVGAMLAILQRGLLAEEEQRAPIDQFGPLISMVVLPYLGPAAARRELHRPPPRPRSAQRPAAVAAGAGRGPRLTYRTTRVLEAIADYPGASNREVAQRAGIVDQGQISRLLGRLEAGGLIEKLGERRTRGAPNSWRLTGQGESALTAV